jgi:hypothetical protein
MTEQLVMADLAAWLVRNPRRSPWDWVNKVLETEDGRPQVLRYVDGHVSLNEYQADEWIGTDDYREAQREACDRLKDLGVRGGFRVSHPYRIHDRAKHALREAGYGEEGEEGGLWDGVREDPLDIGWHQYTAHGMHTHFVGFTGEKGTPAANFGDGGNEIRRYSKDHRDKSDPSTVVEIFQACRYPVTHAAPPDDAPRVTNRFGDAHGAAKRRPQTIIEELDDDHVKGSSLIDQAKTAVRNVLDEVLDVENEDGCMQCPQCGGRDWVSIWQTRDLCEAHDDGHLEIEHRDSLDIARALKQYGPDSTIPVAKAVERGHLDRDPDGTLPEIDLTNPIEVCEMFGLSLADEAPNDDAPAEPPPGGHAGPPDDLDDDPLDGLFGRGNRDWTVDHPLTRTKEDHEQ